MLTIYINGLKYQVKESISILEACQIVGVHIKRFCFHEALSVSGNCRMCLIEIKNSRKIHAACVSQIFPKIMILTNTPYVKKIRENVLEFLLLNHPLDCPICDQGGECDLQDHAKTSGRLFAKVFYNKRGVENKNFGPLIKTIMTRCIHCTRCVRYISELNNVPKMLGTLGRGEQTEIGLYTNAFLNSEISGNVIDICPVGALTSKPHQFKARSWELSSEESIDLLDGLGSNIIFSNKQTEINRVLPKINVKINNSFISDKIRFFFDALNYNRIQKIFLNQKNSNVFLKKIKKFKKRIYFIIDDTASNENLFFLKRFSFLDSRTSIVRHSGIKNKNIFFEKKNSLNLFLNKFNEKCLIIASNLRLENAIINSKIKSKLNYKHINVFNIHVNSTDLNQKLISTSIKSICDLIEGKHIQMSTIFNKNSCNIILGKNSELRFLNELERLFFLLNVNINILNINIYCNSFGLNFFNIKNIPFHKTKNSIAFFILQNDTITIRKILSNKLILSFWLNSFGSDLLQFNNGIIPIESNYDTKGSFFNLEGKPQKTNRTTTGFFKLSDTLNFFFSKKVKTHKKNQYFKHVYEVIEKNFFEENSNIFIKALVTKLKISNIKLTTQPLKSLIENFYTTDIFAKNSKILKLCATNYKKTSTNFTDPKKNLC